MKLKFNGESLESNILKASVKEKYSMLARVLTKVETNLLYKGDIIDGNTDLEDIRDHDIDKLKEIISNELKNDGIKSIFIGGRKLTQLY